MATFIEKLFSFQSPLHIFLFISVLLILAVIVFEVVRHCKKSSCEEVAVAEETVEEPVEEPAVAEETVEEEPEAVAEEPAPETVKDEIVIGDLDDGVESAKRIPFKDKILSAEEKIQGYYNTIDNTFRSFRKINPRVSIKGASYRLGRQLVAKLTIRGKTLKLHLALGIADFDENIYFQKDMSDVKEYVEVPFAVKVRSDRALKNALKLIDALAEKHGIEKKTRYTQIDSIAVLAEKE